MDKNQVAQEALTRAVSSPSMSNYPAIFAGFEAKGIAADDIKPRENVFSFHAWKALGRSVRKGEHGVRISTVRKGERTDKDTGEKVAFSSPWFVTVFHVSQTDAIGERANPIAAEQVIRTEPTHREENRADKYESYYSEQFTETGRA